MDTVVVELQAEVEELRERVADLEQRIARGHDCLIDLCSRDDDGRCRLRARDYDEGES